ncbi:DUF6912 family protein [Nakamurella endophytica]|uniref:Uncharacterized protein n=1 Tax=Nakamurella endophytica TaxID=1748367 RepID=A0A917W9S2_9ACTN|nr:hypothetical protein [Nakamurella endophytica]GGL85892.1 hypothetical protein GCM10011594_02000 [Nakamurella endophytica]
MTRVYVPLTVSGLRAAFGDGVLRPRNGVVFAVTPDLAGEYDHADDEELEYLAMVDAARASLRLLAGAAEDEPTLRVVVAADADSVVPAPHLERSAAHLDGPVPWRKVAAVHVDGADAASVVADAVRAVDAADLGDEDAELVVGQAEDIDLAWYAPSEIEVLLEDVDG